MGADAGPLRDVGVFAEAAGPALMRLAYLLTGGQAPESEDLVHTVLLRLVDRGIDELKDPYAYARRALVNEHRSRGRRNQVHQRALPRLVPLDEPGDSMAQSEDRLSVLDALTSLSDRERAAIVLRYYQDLPDAEIASILRCTRSTVRSLIHRAMPKLKVRLGDAYLTEREQNSPHRGEQNG